MWKENCTLHLSELYKMNYLRYCVFLSLIVSAWRISAQAPEVSIEIPKQPPVLGTLLRPFHLEKRIVSPAKLTNSPRLESLVRSGNIYLSAQDVIALVLENNLDIAIQRYGPFLAQEVLRRAKGGGILRSIDAPILPGPVSVSSLGVSATAAGLAGGAGIGAVGTIVTQAGPAPPNLDPNLFAYTSFGHLTSPQTNLLLNQTTALTSDFQQLYLQYSQSFATGTFAQLSFFSYRNLLNSPSNTLNPNITGSLDFQLSQPLLQGFGRAVNGRDIRVARNSLKFTDLQMKLQVIETVSSVLNLYWDLVSFNEDVRIKQQAQGTAQKLYEDNQYKVKLGTLSGIEVTRAAALVSAAKEDLLIAQTNVAQQETVLKNALSRNGVESAWLDEVHVIPLDRIEVPKTENLKPNAELVSEALSNRPEIQQQKINHDSQEIMLKGTKNALLPALNGFFELTNHGLSGPLSPIYNGCCGAPDPFFVGGAGTLLGQIFRRNFPDYSAGVSLSIPFRNRQAQADYVTDELNLRQTELRLQRAANQIRVEVKNAVIALQQARARYETAVNTRALAEQNLEAEQKRFQYGAVPDTTLVIQAQNDLTADQTAEIQAMANYTHAKIFFDQAVGQTLDVNHISMVEAQTGHVARQSFVPDSVLNERRP
jgi:outer membrane protein